MTIFTEVEAVAETVIHEIVTEAKEIATAAVAYGKVIGGQALDLLVERIKETSLGTAIANLISAANNISGTGVEKFAAVMSAAEAAWAAFTGNGGLTGLVTTIKNALVYVVQALYEQIFPAKTA